LIRGKKKTGKVQSIETGGRTLRPLSKKQDKKKRKRGCRGEKIRGETKRQGRDNKKKTKTLNSHAKTNKKRKQRSLSVGKKEKKEKKKKREHRMVPKKERKTMHLPLAYGLIKKEQKDPGGKEIGRG